MALVIKCAMFLNVQCSAMLKLVHAIFLVLFVAKVSSKAISDYEDILFKGLRPRPPLILIPGILASTLEATVDKNTTVSWFCTRKTDDWFTIWMDPKEFIPGIINCLLDNMVMHYDSRSRTPYNADGVKIRPLKFGHTEGIEFLTHGHEYNLTSYFHGMVEKFVSLGYERNVSIRGAPYDWRLSPPHNQNFMVDFKALIEETYEKNQKIRNVLICHSMGCLYSLYFLQRQEQEWKDKYIKGLITLAAPWSGSTRVMKYILPGESINLLQLVYEDSVLRGCTRSYSSTYFLLPNKEAFPEDKPLLTLEGIDYGVGHYELFFNLTSIPHAKEKWEDSKDVLNNLEHPGVSVACLYGVGLDTADRLVYKSKSDFPDKPEYVYGPGDGSVNANSLRACHKWASNRQHSFHQMTFPGLSHGDATRDSDLIAYVARIVTKWMLME